MSMSDQFRELCGPQGRSILSRHLNGDSDARRGLRHFVEAACDGALDCALRAEPDPDHVHVTTSAHLMTLAVMNRLSGMQSADLYKGDPLRYVRLNLLVQRLLGIERLTIGFPVYAFGAETLGQTMMYPDDQAPGSDPGNPLMTIDGWRDIPGHDRDHEVSQLIRDALVLTGQLADIEPVAHLPAPYSLAAEIFGQEALINALSTDPDTVRDLLAHLADVVLAPWCEDLVANVPGVWLEFSDASGSPMFIGPNNCVSFAVEPVRQLINQPRWGDRVFVANYRGDSSPRSGRRGRRRGHTPSGGGLSFDKLLEIKISCCPFFVIRLEADTASEQAYADAAISNGISLYLGIGAVRLDRNSVVDREAALRDLRDTAFERGSLIRSVRAAARKAGGAVPAWSWPGDLYIEDTNGETDLELFAAVLEGCAAANSAAGRA